MKIAVRWQGIFAESFMERAAQWSGIEIELVKEPVTLFRIKQSFESLRTALESAKKVRDQLTFSLRGGRLNFYVWPDDSAHPISLEDYAVKLEEEQEVKRQAERVPNYFEETHPFSSSFR